MAGLNIRVLSRTKFFSSVACAIFNYKSYPTKDEYNHIGHQSSPSTYFFPNEEGTEYVSAQLTIHYCVGTMMPYM